MHSQPILSGVALDHHSSLNLFGQISWLPKELRPPLNLRPAPKRSIVELLQSKLFEARHTLNFDAVDENTSTAILRQGVKLKHRDGHNKKRMNRVQSGQY
jgi:hypothetical protein